MLVPLFGKYFLAALGVLHRFATEIKPSKLDLDNTSGRNEIMYKHFFILLLFQKTILASNVFAHSDKLREMAECMLKLLSKKGTIIIEVQYLMNTLKDLTFDNIYHEHYNLSLIHI